jgi:thioredoxin-related protein
MKRKNILILIALFFSTSIFAQNPIQWMSWTEAVNANAKNPKLIFVDVYTDWCGWCKRMDATTFQDPIIASILSKHFYAVKLDAEMKDTIMFNNHLFVNPNPEGRRSTHTLAASLLENQLSYPSFVVLTPQFARLQILPGFKDAKAFEPILAFFGEKAYDKMSYEEFMANFQSKIP